MERVPVIGIDLDGVLTNFNRRFLSIVKDISGKSYDEDDVTDYDYSRCLDVSGDVIARAMEEVQNTEMFWARLPCKSFDNVEAAIELAHRAHLYVVTARWQVNPEKAEYKFKTTLGQTRAWLQAHEIRVEGVVRCDSSSEKGNIAAALGCEYFLDDSPKAYLSCVDGGVGAYLYDAPYNQMLDCPRDKRINSVRSYLEALASIYGWEGLK